MAQTRPSPTLSRGFTRLGRFLAPYGMRWRANLTPGPARHSAIGRWRIYPRPAGSRLFTFSTARGTILRVARSSDCTTKMARTVVEYRCLLISPSDVDAERAAISEVVGEWNAQVGSVLGARVHLVRWETHSVPDAAAPPQEALNRQIVDESDFGLAVFWGRLGSPTGSHLSGSIEEIDRLRARGARVLLYFSTSPIPKRR